MQAIVLAAGEGMRMRPLSFTRPKVMLPLANKPILEHLLIQLSKAGIRDVILVVGYRDQVIRSHFGDGSSLGINLKYVLQNPQLGTAHALISASHLVRQERFLVLNGDCILSAAELEKFLELEQMALGVKRVQNPWEYGCLEIRDGYVRKIQEKSPNPPSDLVNAGVYLMNQEIFEAIHLTGISARGEYELTDSIQILIQHGIQIRALELEDWMDVTYPWDLLDANRKLLESMEPRIHGELESNVTIRGNVTIQEGTLVRSGSYIQGPVIIGRDCEIGPNCFIRGSSSIGNGCHIGAAVEIKNSIIMDYTKIPHQNYVGDSVIGEKCNLGAGAKIANLRLDEQTIKIKLGDRTIDTGLRKLGAIIGDDVKIGINACIDAGTLIGNDVWIGPGARVSGIIQPHSRIF